MSRQKGSYFISEYEIYKSKIIGNINWISERYPNDKLLHEHLTNVTNGMCSFINLLVNDNNNLERFKKEIRK